MKLLKILIPFSLSTFFLVGCEKEIEHDVPYYFEHFEECEEQLKKCQVNPAKLDNTPNCINARAAYHKRLMEGDVTGKMPKIRLK